MILGWVGRLNDKSMSAEYVMLTEVTVNKSHSLVTVTEAKTEHKVEIHSEQQSINTFMMKDLDDYQKTNKLL
jgi:hypothetical protein